MNPGDLHAVIIWWFVLFVIGLGFLPLTQRIFSSFFDYGYILAKTIGIGVISYVIFFLGVIRLVPFSRLSVFLLTGIVIIVLNISIYALLRQSFRAAFINRLKKSWGWLIFEEIFFFIMLLFWSYIHAFNPDIHGLEKYMDFGFINSILRSTFFPPVDMWFPPSSINYYYFGHFVTAVLTRLSGIQSNITFNLMMATVFALCLTASFSIGANLAYFFLKKTRFFSLQLFISGLVSALLVTFAGNIHTLYAFFKPYSTNSPLPPWRLVFSPFTFPNSYWYPNATRFIYNTIHEFPIYSWTVADLHGHVLDIPFVLLTIALLFSFWIQKDKVASGKSRLSSGLQNTVAARLKELLSELPIPINLLLLLSFFIAVMYMTNAWDGIIYFLLGSSLFFFILWEKGKEKGFLKHLSYLLSPFLLSIGILGLGAILFSLPFSLFFQVGSIAHGIGVLCAPKVLTNIGKIGPFLFEANHCQKSPWWQLLVLYGFFYFFVISFLAFLFKTKKLLQSDRFILLLILLATILIILPEFFYVKDIYPGYYRANTMFKLVFQSFIMLSLSSGYILIRLISFFRGSLKTFHIGKRLMLAIWILGVLFLITLVAIYPFMSIPSYYNFHKYQSLDGTTYLKSLYPDDYAGIQWLNAHITGQPVILEAQGDSYTDYARVSANTGLPTVLGWTVHEWLWRGSYDVPAPRITEVQTMYESTNIPLTKALLKKYKVRLVFVGNLERQKYPTLQQNKFNALGHPVFRQGGTTIYQLNTN